MGNLSTHIYGFNNEYDVIFIRSSRIHRANVGSHAIIFKSLWFGPFTLKCNPGVFKLKRELQRFKKSQFSTLKMPE